MAYTIQEADAGYFPIANTDAGYTPANGSTVIPTPPANLGVIVRAVDPTYGEGEFICLAGCASTAIGSCVTWGGIASGANGGYGTSLVTAAMANSGRPIAFPMSANTSTSTFGWYQIGGTAVAKKVTTAKFSPGAAVGISSGGFVAANASGKQIENAITGNTATVVSATTTVAIVIDRPSLQGRIT